MTNQQKEAQRNHASETDLDNVPFDYVINNGGNRRYLEQQVNELMQKLREAEKCK